MAAITPQDQPISAYGKPWPAPGKLNLFLRIVGRRTDGYHLLQTVFQFIDRCDQLYFRLREDGLIRRQNLLPDVPEDQDLVMRAARALNEAAGGAPGVDIHVEKRLPMGGGIGGGSSDAATTLVALNALWGLDWPPERLAEIGLGLGADVPVFVHGRAVWAEGVGEQFSPVELGEPWYVVLQPPVHVSTADVFRDPDLTRDSPPIKIRGFVAGGIRNDCEAVVRRRYPPVAEALDWLAQHGKARLTGTGACVFAAFEDEVRARGVLARAPAAWNGFVAKGLNRSPLLDRLDAHRGHET